MKRFSYNPTSSLFVVQAALSVPLSTSKSPGEFSMTTSSCPSIQTKFAPSGFVVLLILTTFLQYCTANGLEPSDPTPRSLQVEITAHSGLNSQIRSKSAFSSLKDLKRGSSIVQVIVSSSIRRRLRSDSRKTGLAELSVDDLPVFESQKIQCCALHRIDEPVWRNVEGTLTLQGKP